MALSTNELLFKRQLERELQQAHSEGETKKLITRTIDETLARQWMYQSTLKHLASFSQNTPIDEDAPLAPFFTEGTEEAQAPYQALWEELQRQYPNHLRDDPETFSHQEIVQAINSVTGGGSGQIARQIRARYDHLIKEKKVAYAQGTIEAHQANRKALGEAYLLQFHLPAVKFDNFFSARDGKQGLWEALKTRKFQTYAESVAGLKGTQDSVFATINPASPPQSHNDILVIINENFAEGPAREQAKNQYGQLIHEAKKLKNVSSQENEEKLSEGRAAFNLYLQGLKADERKIQEQNFRVFGDRYLLQFAFEQPEKATEKLPNLLNEVWEEFQLEFNHLPIRNEYLSDDLSIREEIEWMAGEYQKKPVVDDTDRQSSALEAHAKEADGEEDERRSDAGGAATIGAATSAAKYDAAHRQALLRSGSRDSGSAQSIEMIERDKRYEKEALLKRYEELLAQRKGLIQARAVEAHKTEIDRIALATGPDDATDVPFQTLWTELAASQCLAKPEGMGEDDYPRHHTEFLDWIKWNFKDSKQPKKSFWGWMTDWATPNTQKSYADYYAALNEYYRLLKLRHEAAQKWKDSEGKQLNFALGSEKKRLENELANKETDQQLLTYGMWIGRIYSLSQGFFTGGATLAIGEGLLAMFGVTGWALFALPLGPALAFFYYSTRSNWLTINEEMGPLLKDLFFDPNLAHLSYSKRLWFMVRRTSLHPRDIWNAMKGSTNFAAGAAIGLVTLAGGMALLYFIPPFVGEHIGFSAFGQSSGLVFGIALILALSSTFVYFVINNIFQQNKNKGSDWLKEDQDRLAKLRYITETKNNPLKSYTFNIVVAMTGLAGTLLGASISLFPILASFNPLHFGELLSPLHSSLYGFPVAGLLTAVFFGIALYGISGFYQARTINSTEGLIVGDESGLRFRQLKGMDRANLDVTGQNAPDFDTKPGPQFGRGVFGRIGAGLYWVMDSFFNMDRERDNSEQARKGNAIAQAMPAFSGIAMVGAGTTVTCGAGYLFFNYLQTSLGYGASIGPWPLIASAVAGGIILVAAACGSYFANSAGQRVVQEKVTSTEMIKLDKRNVDALEPSNDLDLEKSFLGGYAHRGAEEYEASRRLTEGEHYLCSGYSKNEKLEATSTLKESLQSVAVGKPVVFTYSGAVAQGDLGHVGAQADMLINGEFDREFEENNKSLNNAAALQAAKEKFFAKGL